MLRHLLERVARLCFAAPRRTLVLGSLPLLALGLWALRVPVDLSFTGMVDQESGPIADYFEVSREHALGGYLLVLVEHQDREPLVSSGETAEMRAALDEAVLRIGEVLDGSDLILTVQPPSDPDWWIRNAPWLITPEQFDAVAAVIESGAPTEEALALAGSLADAPLLRDPPGLRLVQVRMKNDPLEMAVGRWDFFEVESLLRGTVGVEFPQVAISFAGMPAVAAQDQAYTLGLIRKLTPLSLGLVLLLFSLIERRLWSVLTVLWVLVLAMGATLGLVGLLTGGLTLMETFFGVTVFGLGVDFAVHLFVRYREESANALSPVDAVAATLRGTGRGVVAGAVTTAGAFLIVSLAPDPVALHLGLSGGIGLLLCLLLMLLFLPALWGWRAERRAAGRVASNRNGSSPLRLRFEGLSRFSVSKAQGVLIATGILLVASALAATRFEFETDVSKVLNRNVESIATVERIQELYELNGAPWIVTAPTLEKAREVSQAFRESPEFAHASTLADLLPADLAEVERRRERMLELEDRARFLLGFLEALPAGAAATSPLLAPLLARLPELPQGTTIDDVLDQIRSLLRGFVNAPSLGPPTREQLPSGVVERFESAAGEQLILAYARGSSLDGLVAARQREAAHAISPEATSLSVLLETLMLGDRPWIRPTALAIAAFVVFVLLVDFRRPRAALLALVPVVVGVAMTVGILCLVGVRFNIMTLTVLPLLGGLGVDDGIHVVHRMLENSFREPARSAAAVGRAVLMTTLTTCSSFAVLLLTDHPGLETMAWVMLVGLPCCWLASVTTLPALATVLYPQGRRSPAKVSP